MKKRMDSLSLHFLHSSESLKEEVSQFLSNWYDDSPVVRTKTSGSSGIPKWIEHSKEAMRFSARRTLDYFALQPGMHALLCLSPATIAGKMMLVRAIEGRLKLFVSNVQSDFLEHVTEQIHFAAIVPLQLEFACTHRPNTLKSISKLLVGGGILTNSQLEKTTSMNCYQSYGMTETISHVAIRKLHSTDVYRALEGVSFSQNDKNCLVINDTLLGIEGLETNDKVELMDPYTFRWLARIDLVINSGGQKYFPTELEALLYGIITYPFFIGGLPDDRLGERIVLFIESETPLSDLEIRSVPFPGKSSPKQIVYIPFFQRTESGKIDRRKTIEQLLHT